MKKEIRQLVGDVVQVTTVDERWYARDATDTVTGLPTKEYLPSVTWICGHYPKGVGFYKWLATKGWDEAEAIRTAAGDKGSKVHHAIVDLLDGKAVAMDAKYPNPTTGQPEELSLEEYECLMGFADWWRGEAKLKSGKAKHPRPVQTLGREVVVLNEEHQYMGTVDWYGIMELPDKSRQTWLLDWKSGQHVWPEYELQLSAYKHAHPFWLGPDSLMSVEQFKAMIAFDTLKLGVLQIGYRDNERGWKLTEVADQFPLFLAAKAIWAKETAGQAPKQRDYPLALSLPKPAAVVQTE